MLDSALVLKSEKRIFKSVLGTEFDVTFKPFVINMLAKEYALAHKDCVEAITAYQEKALAGIATEADVDDINEKNQKFTDTGFKIILAALKANKLNYDEEYVQDNIALEEFTVFIDYIIGSRQDTDEKTKKK